MSDYSGVFAILPSWGSSTSKTEKQYGVYIISGPCFGLGVIHQCDSPEIALSRFGDFIKTLRAKWSSEEDYFDALLSTNYGHGLCIPSAQKEYVKTTLDQIGNTYDKGIEDLIGKTKFVPARKKLRPVPQFNRVVDEEKIIQKKVFKVNKVC